jgi:hypothetical protein
LSNLTPEEQEIEMSKEVTDLDLRRTTTLEDCDSDECDSDDVPEKDDLPVALKPEEPEVTSAKPDSVPVKKPKKKRVKKLKLSSILEEYEDESCQSEADQKVDIQVEETKSITEHDDMNSKSTHQNLCSKLEMSSVKLCKSVSMDKIKPQIDSYIV